MQKPRHAHGSSGRGCAGIGVLALTAALFAGCGTDDRCLYFEHAPPSARIKLRDASTGEELCGVTVTTADRRKVVRYEELCEYRLAAWFVDGGASVTIQVFGYFDRDVTFDAARNECGELEAPFVELSLEPNPDAEPPDD
jgi:hypothetical protein